MKQSRKRAGVGVTLSARCSCSVRLIEFAFPVNFLSVGPKFVKLVVVTRIGIKDVNNHVAVVLNHPFAGVVAFHAQPGIAHFSHRRVNFFNDRVHLATARSGGDDEEVEDRGDVL
jgi:hypothetical protein